MRTSVLSMLALFLAVLPACGGGSEANGTEATDGNPTGGTGTECFAGYEGCACFEVTTCLEGLACLSNVCVDSGDGTTGQTTDLPGTTGAAESESSGPSSVSGVDGSESSSSESSSGESGSESSSTGELPCVDGTIECHDDTQQVCVLGTQDATPCEEACNLTGYHSTGCEADETACHCEDFADPTCIDGMSAFCFCLDQVGSPCSEDNTFEYYDQCFSGASPEIACFGDYIDGVQVACDAAIAACL